MACENFIELANKKNYDGSIFHRLIKGFMIQGGSPDGSGSGGKSYFGDTFACETDEKNALSHSQRGMLAMANKGPDTNASQFYITFGKAEHLDGRHTVFGKMTAGFTTLDKMEQVATSKENRPE